MDHWECIVSTQAERTRYNEIQKYEEGLYELGSHLYAWMVPNGSWGESNAGLILGDKEALLVDTALGPIITHNGGGIGGNSDFAVYTDRDLIIIITSNRIVWRTLFNTIPCEIRLPATEARQQLAENIASGNFSPLPRPLFVIWPYLGLLLGVLVVLGVAVFWFKRKRVRKSSAEE